MSPLENHALSLALFTACVSKIVNVAVSDGLSSQMMTVPWSAYTAALLSYVSTRMIQTTVSRATAGARDARSKKRARAHAPPRRASPVQEYVYVSAAVEARHAATPLLGGVEVCASAAAIFDLVKVAESIDCRYAPLADRCAYVDVAHCTVALHPDGAIVARQRGDDERAARFAIDCVKRALERRVARCGLVAPDDDGIAYRKGPVIVARQFRYDFEDAIDLDAMEEKLCSSTLLLKRSPRRLQARSRDVACRVCSHRITCRASNVANVVTFFDMYIRPALA